MGYMDRCETYNAERCHQTWRDDDDFTAADMCCECGGGVSSAPTPAPTPEPTPEPILWPQFGESDHSCVNQAFANVENVETQEKCEEIALSKKHIFYQYSSRLMRCASSLDCDNPTIRNGMN